MSRNTQPTRWRRLTAGSLLALGLAIASTTVMAQPRMTPPPVKDMAAALELSADQEIAFTQIFEAHIAKTKALMAKHGIVPDGAKPSYRTRRAMKGELDQNRQALEEQLADILTPEQLEQVKEMGPRNLRL